MRVVPSESAKPTADEQERAASSTDGSPPFLLHRRKPPVDLLVCSEGERIFGRALRIVLMGGGGEGPAEVTPAVVLLTNGLRQDVDYRRFLP
jgi:hypothetical protein